MRVWICTGDHLVGWANSSIRHPAELPYLGELKFAKGIVREDPLQAGLWPSMHKDNQVG